MASLADLSGAAMGNAAVYGGGFDPTPGATPRTLAAPGAPGGGDPYAIPPAVLAQIEAEVNAVQAGNNTTAYDQAYNNAMGVARANITQSIGNALTEIGNRQNTANTGLGQLPGQMGAIYDQATASTKQAADAAAAEQKSMGMPSFLSAQAAEQPGLTAMANANAGAQAAVPTLKIAFDNAFSQERQNVQTQAADKLATLDNEAAMHAADVTKQKSDQANSLRASLIERYYESQGIGSADAVKAAQQYNAAVTPPTKDQPYNSANGKALAKYLPAEAARIKSGDNPNATKAYQEAYQAMHNFGQKWPAPPDKGKHPEQYVQWQSELKALNAALQKHWPNQTQAINLAFFDAGA